MLLFIDAANLQTVRLALVSKNFVVEHHFASENLSERLISEIQKFCKKEKTKLSDLSKLAVLAGPGHFSKIRTAVATANALAYGLGIKVVSVKTNSQIPLSGLIRQSGQGMARPIYDKQPNITRPNLTSFRNRLL